VRIRGRRPYDERTEGEEGEDYAGRRAARDRGHRRAVRFFSAGGNFDGFRRDRGVASRSILWVYVRTRGADETGERRGINPRPEEISMNEAESGEGPIRSVLCGT
jgi:hypothetical protein